MQNRSSHLPTNHSDVPIRLFQSDFLEFFSHVTPQVVLILWGPVAILLILLEVLSGRYASAGWGYLFISFMVGIFIWTLLEYLLHRFLFHFEAQGERLQKFFFIIHGVHHEQPQCKTRLVMPPAVSIPLALIVYGLVDLVCANLLGNPQWVKPAMSGVIVGYLIYDLTHYATHHFPMRRGIWKWLKRYHMQHHYKTPNERFGVSSPVWDFVFRTMPND